MPYKVTFFLILIAAYIAVYMLIYIPGASIAAASAGTSARTSDDLVMRAQAYLKSLHSVKADFVQTAPDGSQLSGIFYLSRPGKLRFIYHETEDFVVADGRLIYFYDSEIDSQSHAPIEQTAANFLLRADLSLTAADIDVQNIIATSDGGIVLTLAQAERREDGSLTLFLGPHPKTGDLTLNEWIIKDSQQNLIRVELRNLTPLTPAEISSDLFVYHPPKSTDGQYNE